MRKFISLSILLLSALLIFNLCFFICIDYDGNTRTWICYVFFHLAYALSLIGYLFTTRRRFAVLNKGLFSISLIYLILTTATSLLFCVISDYSIELELFVFLIELFFYLITFNYCYFSNRKAEIGIVKDLKNASKHDSWIAELRFMANNTEDKEKKQIVTSIIDEIRSCPSLSNPYVCEADIEIQSLINSLKIDYKKAQVTELDNYKRQICSAVKRRTEILKCSYHKI